jgi:hypothetical protein
VSAIVDTLRQLLAKQFEAALCTLNRCIDLCPEANWDAPVANLRFCQAAFHTLFFTDVYLGENPEALRQQAFHRNHPEFFRDYEEMENRAQVLLYDRPSIKRYLAHCRRKATDVLADETEESLNAQADFPRKTFSRAELHVYNIRHIQHHAAQLSLRLRLDARQDVRWVGSGWPDA